MMPPMWRASLCRRGRRKTLILGESMLELTIRCSLPSENDSFAAATIICLFGNDYSAAAAIICFAHIALQWTEGKLDAWAGQITDFPDCGDDGFGIFCLDHIGAEFEGVFSFVLPDSYESSYYHLSTSTVCIHALHKANQAWMSFSYTSAQALRLRSLLHFWIWFDQQAVGPHRLNQSTTNLSAFVLWAWLDQQAVRPCWLIWRTTMPSAFGLCTRLDQQVLGPDQRRTKVKWWILIAIIRLCQNVHTVRSREWWNSIKDKECCTPIPSVIRNTHVRSRLGEEGIFWVRPRWWNQGVHLILGREVLVFLTPLISTWLESSVGSTYPWEFSIWLGPSSGSKRSSCCFAVLSIGGDGIQGCRHVVAEVETVLLIHCNQQIKIEQIGNRLTGSDKFSLVSGVYTTKRSGFAADQRVVSAC